MAQPVERQELVPVQQPPSAAKIVLRLVIIVAVLAALLFIPAGRLDWVEAWVFVISYTVLLVAYGVWGLLRDPGQLAERSRMASNVKGWDRVINVVYTLLLLAGLIVTGLDAGRFGWSSVPTALKVVAWFGLALSSVIIASAMVTNTYLSRMARIQEDRGHKVVSSGPYRFVRHPMYLGIIVMFLSLPPALGSLYGLIPASLIGLLFLIRTSKEDTMLRQELAGYEEYAQRVRHRILPGIW